MESNSTPSVSIQRKNQQVYSAIVNGLTEYEKDRSKCEVWNRVFWTIGVYFGKEGAISADAQKLINFYLQNKSQSSQLGAIISQNKELICKIYDFALSSAENIDQAISTGSISQAVIKKFQKNFQSDLGQHSAGLKVLIYCVELVVIHFCEFLQRFKNANGTNILCSKRKIPKIIRRKYLHNISKNSNFIDQVFKQPAVLLEGFLDIAKPILTNNLNIESLFEVTNPHFRHKKALINGVIGSSDEKNEFIGKIVSLNTIFDCTYAGREMIESKLNQLKISEDSNSTEEKWSILTCLTELQFKIQVIIEKLPLFMRPKTSGDILSYCRKQIAPTFRYHVMKAGFIDKPIFSQFMTLFLNVGRSHFQILCFEKNSPEVASEFSKHQKSSIFDKVIKLNVAYTKLRVGPKSIVVVPNNNYYVLIADNKNLNVLTEIVSWSVLPKYSQPIKRCLQALDSKSKQFRNYTFIPVQQMFFDYLSHEYLLLINQSEVMATVAEFLSSRLNKEQFNLQGIASRNPELPIELHNLPYLNRSCMNCKGSIVNYYCRNDRRENICMGCAGLLGAQEQKKLQYAAYIQDPRTLRYPITIAKILMEKRKHPGQKVENPYEKHVCSGQFIGSINSEACKSETKDQQKDQINSAMSLRKDEIYFTNRLKEQRIVSIDELLASIALSEPKSTEDRELMVEKIRNYLKQISEPESFIKSISVNWSKENLVSDLMWAYRASQNSIFTS